ncbi:MAG: CBS domain-containing protein, partial [Flavobacteriales bacterium]|nr:CBS domain-containing protein [Flavobacteriales bacterium]
MIGTEQHLVGPGTSLGDAMSRLGRTGLHLTLFVVDADGRLLGSITDGDIRRALLGGATLASPVSAIMNTRPQHLAVGEAAIGRLARMREQGLRLVPLVNVTGHVTGM